MKRICTFCGKTFEIEKPKGRPQSLCSQECKEQAKLTGRRQCVQCAKTFKRSDSRWPNHCSDACHAKISTTCSNPTCSKSVPTFSTYCSAKCLVEMQGTPACKVCGNPVKPPRTGPYDRMPVHCREQCRAVTARQRGYIFSDSAEFTIRFREGQQKAIDLLPLRENEQPYLAVDPETMPKHSRNEMGQHSYRSIEWWNHILPIIRQRRLSPDVMLSSNLQDVYIAMMGMRGWGGGETNSNGCQRLIRVWPWLTPEASAVINPQSVMALWRAYNRARPQNAKQVHEKRQQIIDMLTNKETVKKIKNSPKGRAEIRKKIRNVNSLSTNPHPEAWIPPQWHSWISKLEDLSFDHNLLYVAMYPVSSHDDREDLWAGVTREWMG